MEEIKKLNIYQKLLHIQNKLKAPKNQYNSFGKYKYRNCEDILEALKSLLLEYNCVLIINDKIDKIENRFYVSAAAKLICCDTEKEIISQAYAREEETKKGMDGSQVTGASSSYARKYALNGLFLIDDTKDSDSYPETKPEKEPETKTETNFNISQKQANLLNLEISKRGKEADDYIKKVLEYLHIKEIKDMQIKDFNKTLNAIKSIKEV